MATTPTQNSVPSESPRDLKFNAGKIDEFVTSLVNTYVDRFGNEHYTIEGLRWLAQQAIAQYGWILIDSFQDGADITLPNQALRDESTGEYYRWDGALPKHVDAGSTPSSSGGVGIGAWLSIGDAALRTMLASNEGAKGIGTSSGNNAQYEFDSLHKSIDSIPSKFSIAYSEDIVGVDYAQGLAETDDYWFIGYDNNHAGHVKRIRKSDLSSVDSGTITSSHLQGIAVIDDNTIMVGGNNEGEIIRYSFTTGISTTIATTGFRKDYPFCWDGEYIYQMQNIDPSISTAEFSYLALIKPGAGVVRRSEMFRKYIRQGYIQGMTIHNGELIFFTGGSFSGDQLANRNIATIYKTSLSGTLLDAKQFYKTSFIANFGTTQSYESQGVSCFNNYLTISCYVSGKLLLLKEDDSLSGKEVGTNYSLNEVFYYGMSEVGITDAQLSTGGIQLIVNTMVDNSRLIQSVSSDTPNLQSIIGMPYGVLEIIKLTNYRAVCKFYYDSSDLASPKSAVCYVYDTSATPFYFHKLGRLTSPVLYQSTTIASTGTISISGLLTLNKLAIEITNTTATNPVVRDVYDTDDMNHLSSNSITVLTTSGSSSVAYRLLSTGIQVTAVTGSPIIRFVTGS
ncbi:tail fiber/spike domain-containing protein [Enterobacter cloacae]